MLTINSILSLFAYFSFWFTRISFTRISNLISGNLKARAYVLVAGAVVLWASWPALATLVHPAPPFLVLGLSALIGFVFSFVLSVAKGESHSFFSVRKRTMVLVAVGLMGNNAFYLAAIARIGPAEANVVHYLWPLFLVGLASLVHRKLPTFMQFVGMSAGFVGVAIALAPTFEAGLDIAGVLLGVCGALTFAIYSIARSLAPAGGNVVGPSLGLAALIALTLHMFLEHTHRPDGGQWIAIALMGIGPFMLANILWDKATRAGSAATISSLAFLTPLVAISILATLGLGTVTSTTIAGALLAVLGAFMASQK